MTLLTIYFIDFLGQRALGSDWIKLRKALAGKLADLADDARENALWGDTYRFPDPGTAVQACGEAVDGVTGAFRWRRTGDPLPVQFLLHDEDPDTPLGLDQRAWAYMLPEEIYATKRAWEQWRATGEAAGLPPHTTRDEMLAALRLCLEGRPPPPPTRLFPNRTAPLGKGGEECFYCGLRDHRACRCPSRQLRPDVAGLTLVGRMSLAKAHQAYARTFPPEGKPAVRLAAETGPDEVRRSHELQALAAFFDLRRVFQLRFLVTLYLAGADGWPEIKVSRGGCGTATSPISRGVRALLAGDYSGAENLFSGTKGTDPGTRFFAEIGLAMLAVEKGQRQLVRSHLDRAGKLATAEAERVYVVLLRSRLQETGGDLPGALRIVDEALERLRPCDDLRYRRDQLAVLAGRTDGCAQRLQLVAARHPETAVALLLDPWLEPIREELDRKLLSLFLTAQQGGKGKYAAAVRHGSALVDWLGDQDPDVAPLITGLRSLGGKVSRAGYFDMVELERSAGELATTCEQTRRNRANNLRDQLVAVEELWQPLWENWQGFGLKRLYPQLAERFVKVQADLHRARLLADQQSTAACKEATGLIDGSRQGIAELAVQTREIGAIPLIYQFVRRFLGYLVIFEALALALGYAILPLLARLLSPGIGHPPSLVTGSSTVFSLTLIGAPALALVLAALKHRRRPPGPIVAQVQTEPSSGLGGH